MAWSPSPQAAAMHASRAQGEGAGRDQPERNLAPPEIPTVMEKRPEGLRGRRLSTVSLAPANLPRDVSAKLSDAFRQVLANPDIRNRMITQGADPPSSGPRTSRSTLAAEMPRWRTR